METTLSTTKTNTDERKATYILLEVIFFLSIGLLAYYKPNLTFTPFEFFVFVMATFRTSRVISQNEIGEWFRRPFVTVGKDSSGAGESVDPKEEDEDGRPVPGYIRAIGGLVACFVCSGTWAAAGLLAVHTLAPVYGRYLVYVLAIAGGSELVNWTAELVEWTGRSAREVAGSFWMEKNK